MSQQLVRLIPQLKVPVRPVYRRFCNPEGSYGRLKKMRGVVTSLVRDERIEGFYYLLDEARPYAERLLQDAIRLGDRDVHTMDMANFWLEEKQLIYKLFQVLAPRFENCHGSFTRFHRLPKQYDDTIIKDHRSRSATSPGVLELKGNPFPPIRTADYHANNRRMLHNVLLEAVRRRYRHDKFQQQTDAAAASDPAETNPSEDHTLGDATAEPVSSGECTSAPQTDAASSTQTEASTT